GFVSTRSVQEHQRGAVGPFRHVDAMHERQVAIYRPLIARQSELRQHGPDIGFVLAEMLRNEEARSEIFKRLVQGKTGSVARNFDQRSGRLANIERIEIGPVMNGGGAELLGIEFRMKF